jgi:type IV pilus assembly protein PilC
MLFKKKVKFSELTSFTRQFSAMIGAKIDLVRILEILSQQTENSRLNQLINKIKKEVQGGKSLADSFAKYPDVFSDFYRSMITVGEMTGQLDHMLERVAVYLEKINALRRKLIQAMAYPILVMVVAFAAVSFLLTYVVPSFSDMFRDFDAELPVLTVLLMQTSKFITDKLWILMIFFIGTGIGLRFYFNTENGKWFGSKSILLLPISGPILIKNYVGRFSRTLSILLESGIPILEALKVTADSIPNLLVKKEIKQMHYYAEKGEMLIRSMKRSKVFPPMVVQMIIVGEETAQLDKMLAKIADYYDDEIEATLSTLTTILEPLIIIVLGIILGTILIALYLPLFDLVNIVPG